ncbi:MAG TPA: TlpA disulfide reductase family protein [Capsulimonadaceae bacterium]|jgi:peroxiredoxin
MKRLLQALILAAALSTGRAAAPTRHVSLPLGSVAPAISLAKIDGQMVSSNTWNGKTVVLNFWAFWCDTWKAELPDLEDLTTKQDELHFKLIAISVDATRQTALATTSPDGAPFPILLDARGSVSDNYKISSVPTVVVVDPSGRVRYTASGYPGNQPLLSILRIIDSESRTKTPKGGR